MNSMGLRLRLLALLVICCARGVDAQVIEFESGGLKYLTMSRNGLTVMFAHMPAHVREFAIVQVAVSNGAPGVKTVRPEDCSFRRSDGTVVHAAPARAVVDELMRRGNRNDVIKLVSTYEAGLYGMQRFRSTNGYELRRQAALAEVTSTKLKAAAAASAIALVETRLKSGESTDGAVFFRNEGKPLGPGELRVRAGGDVFEFPAEAPPQQLRTREPEH